MIPDYYRPPLGLPLNWRDEVSGKLPAAVYAYLDNRIDGTPLSDEHLAMVREYIEHHINAPCWEQDEFREELAALRKAATELKTPDDVGAWIRQGMDIGLDPL